MFVVGVAATVSVWFLHFIYVSRMLLCACFYLGLSDAILHLLEFGCYCNNNDTNRIAHENKKNRELEQPVCAWACAVQCNNVFIILWRSYETITLYTIRNVFPERKKRHHERPNKDGKFLFFFLLLFVYLPLLLEVLLWMLLSWHRFAIVPSNYSKNIQNTNIQHVEE